MAVGVVQDVEGSVAAGQIVCGRETTCCGHDFKEGNVAQAPSSGSVVFGECLKAC